jgi:hypothetical protein
MLSSRFHNKTGRHMGKTPIHALGRISSLAMVLAVAACGGSGNNTASGIAASEPLDADVAAAASAPEVEPRPTRVCGRLRLETHQ